MPSNSVLGSGTLENVRYSLSATRSSRRAHAGGAGQRLDRRGEQQAPGGDGVVDRLLAHAVAREDEPAASAVPDAEREHAVDRLDDAGLALLVEVDDDFGVGARPELVAIVEPQRLSQRGVGVDLPVERDPDRAVLVGHRLVPGGAEVDDGEHAMA